MKTLFVYYSYSGTTEKLAQLVATHCQNVTLERLQLETPESNNFLVTLFVGGYQALKGQPLPIKPPVYNLNDYDTVILAGPMRASHSSPAILSYVTQYKDVLLNKKLGLLVVSGSGKNEPALSQLTSLLNNKTVAKLAVAARSIGNDTTLGETLKNWFTLVNA